MIKLAMILGAALMVAPAWAINKCKTPDGQTVFQDAPCAGTGITVAEDLAQKKAAADREKATDKESVQQKTYEDLEHRINVARDRARAACRVFLDAPVLGMSEADFKNCTAQGFYEAPDAVNETETSAGISKQYVYRGNAGIRYVYFRNGVITAIQR